MPSESSKQWTVFKTPACCIDFPADSAKQAALDTLWNDNLTGFTDQGITGNPWTSTNSSDQNLYFNPATTDISAGGYAQIEWSPVPGRISYYFPDLGNDDIWSLADTGYDTKGNTFAPITTDPCNASATATKPYGPYGPRGWQDEYCEWSVRRDAQGNILRIDFCCENPEYWNSLWLIDPGQVLELYRETLGKPQIALEDLYLTRNGQPVIDPSSGRPTYNPLNKWNSGTVSTDDAGGAMHLTSTPNTLQTEIGLGSTATTPRTVGNANPQTLICCAQYGQVGRNSDPHIGQKVNQAVTPLLPGPSQRATLANPPGLYIQQPDFGRITGPAGVDVTSFWTVKRGATSLVDGGDTTLPGSFILHAVFEAPAGSGHTVSDLLVDNVKVTYGAQLADTFLMAIAAMVLPLSTIPADQPCAGSPDAADTLAQALQLFHTPVFAGMAAQSVPNPVGQAMTLLSNSTMIAPQVARGASDVPMTLVLGGIADEGTPPSIVFGDGITVAVTGAMTTVTYAIPGNTYPSANHALPITVSVAADAAPGLRGALVNNPGQSGTTPAPAMLHIV